MKKKFLSTILITLTITSFLTACNASHIEEPLTPVKNELLGDDFILNLNSHWKNDPKKYDETLTSTHSSYIYIPKKQNKPVNRLNNIHLDIYRENDVIPQRLTLEATLNDLKENVNESYSDFVTFEVRDDKYAIYDERWEYIPQIKDKIYSIEMFYQGFGETITLIFRIPKHLVSDQFKKTSRLILENSRYKTNPLFIQIDKILEKANSLKTVTATLSKEGNNIQISPPQIFKATTRELYTASPSLDSEIINWIIKNKKRLPAPFYFDLARRLARQGKSEEAFTWFKLGNLLMMYDVKRCSDSTAAHAIEQYKDAYSNTELDDVGKKFSEVRGLELLEQALAEFKSLKNNYLQVSPMYLCSRSVSAFYGVQGTIGNPEVKPIPVSQLTSDKKHWESYFNDTYQEFYRRLLEAKS